jgi:UDP-N-acetylmuramoyl-tripeptide--D-alanyl-D-alanine ligase
VIQALGTGGTAVFPADDAYAPLWRTLAGEHKVLTFATGSGADVTAVASWRADSASWDLTLQTPAGSAETVLYQAGRHNLHNALAATAAALAAGAPLAAVVQGLASFLPVAGRSQTLALRLGGRAVTLIDDSYNANPDSVLAAIDVLATLPAPRWLVLGDMGEVGVQGPAFHAEVGAHAQRLGIEHVWAAGELCAHVAAERHFETVASLLEALAGAPPAASILVKGSRFMKMEQVVQALKAAHEREAGDAA